MDQTNIYVGIAAAVLSLLFGYVPGLKTWYESKTAEVKQLVMLGVLALTVAGAYGLSCAGQVSSFTCDTAGIWDAVWAFVIALTVNQGVYKGTQYIRKG